MLNDSQKMRRDWDERALKNPKPTVCWVPNVNEMDWVQLLQTGEIEVQERIQPFLDRMGFDPADKAALEIGCGWGRMSHPLARRFGTVMALDVSPEMLKQARAIAAQESNLQFLPGNGIDLHEVGDGSIDFCCTVSVFLHIPSKSIIFSYIREIGRVLKSGGLCVIQFNAYERQAWLRRLHVSIRPSRKVPVLHRKIVVALEPGTWHGANVKAQELETELIKNQIDVLDIRYEELGRFWIEARKK